MIPLQRLKPGHRYQIRGFSKTINAYYKSKLLAMGLLPNQVFDVIRKAPLGRDTVEIRVNQSSLIVRNSEFMQIQCRFLAS